MKRGTDLLPPALPDHAVLASTGGRRVSSETSPFNLSERGRKAVPLQDGTELSTEWRMATAFILFIIELDSHKIYILYRSS